MADSQRKSYNLFDKNATDTSNGYEANHYLDGNGDSGASSNHNISEYIDISQYSTITISGADTSSYAIQNTFYNANKEKISHFPCNTMPKTVTVPNNAKYIRLTITKSRANEIMLISGSIPKPYEAYGAWVHSLRKLTTATEAVENPLYTDGTAITSYTIKGNTVQSGTPTPSVPIVVQGVGEETANLFGGFVSGVAINTETGAETPSSSGFTSDFIPVEDNSIYSYTGGNDTISTCFFAYDSSKAYIGRSTNDRLSSATLKTVTTAASGYKVFANSLTGNTNPIAYIRVGHLSGTQAAVESENIMLNTGSTALPYEPYGYKIPILTTQGSAVNYLGSVQSYREIAKYVFDGTDNFTWTKSGTRNFSWFFNPLFLPDRGKERTPFLCSHGATVTTLSEFVYGTVYADNTYNLGIFPSELSTVTELRQWLATQYANGTPVTIWYSLYTPNTATVNEPLMKIGTYADSISNAVSIPTTDGANTITVDTTVQPSEFTATWTGWHNASVKEWDGSDWQ